jgi:hypothetical protein
MLSLLMASLATAAPYHPIANLEIFTSFPTDVGIRGTFEMPARLRVTGSVGWLPRPYLDVINDTAVANGWYKEKEADLIDAALKNAVVIRTHLGWRPFPKLGFQFELGYSWIGLGGGLTGGELLEAETGYDLSYFLGDDYNFSANAELHRVEASFGWEHVIAKHLLIRWDLGGSYTFRATAKVEHQFETYWPFTDPIEQAEEDAEEKLVTILEKNVHTPILAVGVGWRFQ